MATKTVVCPECGEPAPYGRLACPTCGTLLAAVAGRSAGAALASVPFSEPPTLAEDEPEPVAPAPVRVARRGRAAPPRPRDVEADAVDDNAPLEARSPVAGAGPVAADAPAPDAPSATPAEPAPDAPPPQAKPPAVPPSTPAYAPTPAVRARTGRSAPPPLEDWPADRPLPGADLASRPYEAEADWDGVRPDDVPGPWAAQMPSAAAVPAAPSAPRAGTLGAYLPPSASYVVGTGGTAAVAGGAAYGHATVAPMRTTGAVPATTAPATPASEAKLEAGSAPLLADLPFDAPDTLAGWLVAVGSGVATISFLLPWADRLLGAGGVSGYMNGWGLANGSNLLVFLGTAIVLALSTVPNRVPTWFRSGVVPVGVGGLVVGLAWPYVFSVIGRFGVIVAAGAGILMIIGGVLALRPRHERGGTAV